jgi:hypothetical protein
MWRQSHISGLQQITAATDTRRRAVCEMSRKAFSQYMYSSERGSSFLWIKQEDEAVNTHR